MSGVLKTKILNRNLVLDVKLIGGRKKMNKTYCQDCRCLLTDGKCTACGGAFVWVSQIENKKEDEY